MKFLILSLFMASLLNPTYLFAIEDNHSETTHEKHDEDKRHDEHNEDDGHESHDEHEESKLEFSKAQLKEFSIELAQVSSGMIHKTLELRGEIVVEPQRLHHVSPQVSGIVRKVYKQLGDSIKKGDLLATLSSQDLTNAKARLITANSLLNLANTTLKREQSLYQQQITAKRDYLAAQQAHAEMSAKYQAEKQRLLVLGLNQQAIRSILTRTDKNRGLYQLYAPANGIIIKQHLAQGEIFKGNTNSFTLADLSKVWVNLTVYQKDLPDIYTGQTVWITSRFKEKGKAIIAKGVINWLSPILDEATRSATARVSIDNPKGYWRPGLFVNAEVTIEKVQVNTIVPQSALQTLEGKTVVFVQHADGEFEPQTVKIGRKDSQQVEILEGLSMGQTYVSKNSFVLKAQSQKGEFSEGHSH
ncbi:MAG: efflux RND transporter periplasmic adaptor subunit [Methylococcales bacterium]|nr:efflux RND transporter periplasmic adaptor subunit [Methylococcales bacterium]